MVKPSESQKTLSEVSKDLFNLFAQFRHTDEVSSLYTFKLLERVLNEHCNLTDDVDNPVEILPVVPAVAVADVYAAVL